jgi:nucleotide-binding universal stress UspA family protein
MTRETIVVGVDGSAASLAALRWAAAEARLRDARLNVVHAWDRHPPREAISADDWAIAADAAEGLADAIVARALGEAPDVEVETTAVFGPAGPVLTDASDAADLLVVGSRGLGGFRGLLLGSVGHHVAQHARCPVVVVHEPLVAAREIDERAHAGAVHA